MIQVYLVRNGTYKFKNAIIEFIKTDFFPFKNNEYYLQKLLIV